VFFLQQICKLLMKQAFQDLARCEGHEGDLLMGCGSHIDGVCNACCADGGCNYGTCGDIRSKSIKYVAEIVLWYIFYNLNLMSLIKKILKLTTLILATSWDTLLLPRAMGTILMLL